MKKFFPLTLLFILIVSTFLAKPLSKNFSKGTPAIKSMSTLAFSSEGFLFIGDSKSAIIFAVDLGDKTPNKAEEALEVHDLEGKIAAMLGTTPDEILIHDMAVNPISQNVYLSVSRGRGRWVEEFYLPNDVADATILLKVAPDGTITEAPLKNIEYSEGKLPNPVDENKKHSWKEGIGLRVDTITDLVYSDSKLFIAGLSNEEFASTMRIMPFPFGENASATTLEIFHGAHGKYETHAPIRTFLPYKIRNQPNLLAAYLCTPLVTFPITDLKNGMHVKGQTVAEFGSGNYPMDMVLYKKAGKDHILMANSDLPLLTFDPLDIEEQTEPITTEVKGYLAGVSYEPRSGAGIQQIDNLNAKYILALQRMSNGKLNLRSLDKRWL